MSGSQRGLSSDQLRHAALERQSGNRVGEESARLGSRADIAPSEFGLEIAPCLSSGTEQLRGAKEGIIEAVKSKEAEFSVDPEMGV